MVEGPSRWVMVQLLFILASAEPEKLKRNQVCTDFQSASLLRGTNLRVQFLLFTSSNSSCGQLLSISDDLQNTNFNASLGTKIIIHGFRALGTKPSWINELISSLLKVAQVNVIAVDWVNGATAAYPTAVENVTKLALEISSIIRKLLISWFCIAQQSPQMAVFHTPNIFLLHLIDPKPVSCISKPHVSGAAWQALGVPETSIHLIGVSLGAHVGGLVGHFYEGRLGRITGLDPAGPKYTRASREERLDPGDALFVEALHTDADSYNYLICDHMRAVHFYISALEDSCPMVAFPCSSYTDFLAGHCLNCANPFLLSCPRLGLLDSGGVNMEKLPTEVKVYLATATTAPYCVYHSLVEFHLQQRRTLDTSIEITFLGSSNSSFSTRINIPKQQTMGKGLLTHSAPLCQIERVMLQYRPKIWRIKKNETPIVGQFCTASLPVNTR
ncbi:hypothetical protein lerEdw1_020619 [Lerista edwardsae]|nr:hypothetical protein lerEdw1_020619 [Lerista edwardsae]